MAIDREYLKQQAKLIRDEYRQGANTAHRVGSLLLAMIEAGVDIDNLSEFFLSVNKSVSHGKNIDSDHYMKRRDKIE